MKSAREVRGIRVGISFRRNPRRYRRLWMRGFRAKFPKQNRAAIERADERRKRRRALGILRAWEARRNRERADAMRAGRAARAARGFPEYFPGCWSDAEWVREHKSAWERERLFGSALKRQCFGCHTTKQQTRFQKVERLVATESGKFVKGMVDWCGRC